MKFTVMPSLLQIALQKVAIALWSGKDAKKLMSKALVSSNCNDRRMVFTEYTEKVRKEALDLPLPKQLKQKLISFVKPIGFQLYMWIDYHSHWCGCVENLPTTFHFTVLGTVDNEAMAKMLVQDPSIDVINRFKLACMYSLIPHVHTLWEQLPEETWEDLKRVPNKESCLVSFWCHCLTKQLCRLRMLMRTFFPTYSKTLSRYAFLAAAVSGNLTSTRHFLQKLTHEEKETTIYISAEYVLEQYDAASIIPKNYYADVLCYLLSMMNEQQQLKLFMWLPRQTLMCFLEWPWDTQFLELFERMHHFLTDNDYHKLLYRINDKVVEGYTDQNYQNLFATVFLQIPNIDDVQDFYLYKTSISPLMYAALKEHISLILKGKSGEEREEILLGEGKIICKKLICIKVWDLFRWFIQTCAVSKETLITFKGEFKKYFAERSQTKFIYCMWDKSSQICDEFIQAFEKRKISEDDQPVKKFCPA